MAAETSHFRLPPTLNVTDGNVAVNYKKWKRQVEVYLMACGATEKSGDTQVAIILNCAGGHILDIFDQFQWEAEEDKTNTVKLFQKLEEYCNPRRTEVVESFRFWNHKYSESDNFDTFLTELRTRSDSCNFAERDRNIRDKIVFSVTGKLQELLLREENLDLTKAVKICRAYEQSNKHVKELRETLGTSTSTQRVNRVYKEDRKSTNFPSKKPTPRTSSGNTSSSANQKTGQQRRGQEHYNECDFCGYRHKPDKSKCPAWGKTCDSCKGRNHFKNKCKKINAVISNSQISDDEEFDDSWLAVVKKSRNGNFVTACMNINDLEVRFHLDTASDVNTISEKYVHKKQIRKTTTRLLMWNRTNLNPIGEAELTVINPRTSEAHKVLFIVVPDNLMCLLGLKATQEMGLITFNDEKFISSVKVEPLGNLGEVSLVVDPNVREKALPCRKVPLSLEEEVKKAIDVLVERSILVPVTEPTKWVSQMAVVRKPTGALRICIDPQPLNSALIREYYKLPTLDDVLPKLHNARIFSKVDVREAYYHCCLDEESSLLTTMITPFGRYRWSRLPFGLKVSSEIFQRKLIEVLGDLHGVFTIADDIIVVGCGSTDIEAKRDNERKLASLYQRCEQQNIRLNDAKKEIALTEISFHGHRITRDGVKVDNAKVRAILDMKPPTDVSGVKRYCGMIQYMAKFLPDLASTLEPIRALTRKGTEWYWSKECEDAFRKTGKMLTRAPVLAYFDINKEVVIQVDSSKDGIGAVLLQEGKPVEFASRSLTVSERNWAQIEKEALSILYGLERFDQYTYGRPVKVQNDHKPLAAILKKPLSSAPKRLQDIMMKLYRYDIEFEFVKGVNLVIADTLSRAVVDDSPMVDEERPRIMSINIFAEIPDERLQEIKEATTKDETLQELLLVISNGWPEHRDSLPGDLKPYFDMRDVLSYEDGIILKGEAVVIPKECRADIKNRLHSAHLGYDSMMRRARGTVFWSGMAKDIKQMADYCEACQEMKPRNQKETLKQPDTVNQPWAKIGTDLFEIKGRNYLVSIDYYSNFIEVELLTSTTSSQVIQKFKKQFARFGIPKVIVSDGGPQFISQDFNIFCKKWGISHVKSSPGHQSANGKAESAVKLIKHMMIKTLKDGRDQNEALLELRNTPRQDTGLSPAMMMFNRPTRSLLPVITKNSEINQKRLTRKDSVRKCYNKRACDLVKLSEGQSVYFEHKRNEMWKLGKIVAILGDRTYNVMSRDGAIYRRNRVHIRPTKLFVNIRDKSPIFEHDFNHTTNTDEPVVNPGNDTMHNDIPIELSNSSAINDRPKRAIKPPKYLEDYVRY